MNPFTLPNKELKKHFFSWVLIIAFIMLIDPIPGDVRVNIIGGAVGFGNYIFLYYALALNIFPKLYTKQFLVFFMSLCTVFIVFVLIKYVRVMYIVPKLGGTSKLYGKPVTVFIIDAILQLSIIGSCAFVFYLNKLNIYKLALQKQKEEVLINNELDFLKGQFNTHLTFNFLNFCYSHLNKYSEKATNSIEVFSDMLEYSLRTNLNESVPLEHEIEYLDNFVELQKALSSELYVVFNYENKAKNKSILPRLLVTFVENVFIREQLNNKEYPIEINMKASKERLDFSVKNKITRHKKPILAGLGEDNLKQILEMHYKGKYKIDIKQLNEFYTSTLTIIW